MRVGEWVDLALGDVLTLQRGFDLPARARRPGPHPIVSSSGVTGFHSESKVEPPGVVIGRYGSLGSVHWVTEPFWPLNTSLWVKDFKGNDERFVACLLRTVAVDGSAASAVPGVNRNHLHKLPVSVPSLTTQRRIAAVLSAFDELIEINERRIELLEDLARSLYREWFVRFRFPGHEDVELVDSELGTIPEGWIVTKLGAVATIAMGQSPRSEFYNQVGAGLPFHQGVADYGPLLPTHDKYCTVEARTAEPSDVLCSVRAPVGRLNLADQRIVIGRGLSAVRRTDGSQAFLLLQLRQALGQEDSIGGGTIYKAVGKRQLACVPVLEPHGGWVGAFEGHARPMLDERVELTLLNRQLATTRDLLLPRLVTGRLDISDVDLGILTPTEAE
jgi:type I restriction enzyme S subunit